MPNSHYKNEAMNTIYDMLFCDQPALYKNGQTQWQYPWNFLFEETLNVEAIEKITQDLTLESRPKILAYNKLFKGGVKPPKKELLGIIIEVHLEEGLDVLAAYRDGTARYINHSEKLIIWDTTTEQSNQLVKKLFAEGEQVIEKIGPREDPRLPCPPPGDVRLTFLVSDGLYFGQGPIDVLFNDPMGAPTLQAATMLMQHLTENNQP